MTIEVLPDDALLGIFDFYVAQAGKIEAWFILVHVCQRWRNIVLAYPRRLNLRLLCTKGRPVRKMLDVWPKLPIVVMDDADDIITALRYRDRVCQINLRFLPPSLWDKFIQMMQESFPMLTRLRIGSRMQSAAVPVVLPDSFLGGFAPHLQELNLRHVRFPALPKLLLSANYLVDLSLWNIPHSGYISPEVLASCLSSLTMLKEFRLKFDPDDFPQSLPDRASRLPSSSICVDLPALILFHFWGMNDYLEDFVARINAPLLRKLAMKFIDNLLFDISQLTRFIGRIEIFKVLDRAQVFSRDEFVTIILYMQELGFDDPNLLLELRLSPLVQICSSSLLPLSSSEDLVIAVDCDFPLLSQDESDTENTQWLEILKPFISGEFVAIRETFAPGSTGAARAYRGKGSRSVACATEYFCKRVSAIGRRTGSSWAIHRRAAALWLSCDCLPLGLGEGGQGFNKRYCIAWH